MRVTLIGNLRNACAQLTSASEDDLSISRRAERSNVWIALSWRNTSPFFAAVGYCKAHIDNNCNECQYVLMPATMTEDEAAARLASVLAAARWCFLNFGFAKTTFEDIAKRAQLSRTLLYRLFKDKEALYRAVFVDWLVSRQPAAKQAAKGPGTAYERLMRVCRLLALEPWAEMVGAPMGSAFFDACERIDPQSEALYRKIMLDCVVGILGDKASAVVFLLALDGLFADHPSIQVLEQRTQLLAAHFTPRSSKKGTKS
jgi:TetR/AcrR family transcriptional regulator, transcriptional repressor of aconitase